MPMDSQTEQCIYKEPRETHRQNLTFVNEMEQSLASIEPKIWGRLHFLGSFILVAQTKASFEKQPSAPS
jgi:hypothetical protein